MAKHNTKLRAQQLALEGEGEGGNEDEEQDEEMQGMEYKVVSQSASVGSAYKLECSFDISI